MRFSRLRKTIYKWYSVRLLAIFTLLILAGLAFGVAHFSSVIYHDLAINNQRESLERLFESKSLDLISDLQETQKVFGFKLIKEKTFKNAFSRQDMAVLESWLKQSFNRYFVTAGLLDLKALIIKDLDYKVRLNVNTLDGASNYYPGCIEIDNQVRTATGSEKIKPKYAVCSDHNDVFSEVLVPIGTLKPQGYLQIVVRLAPELSKLEAELDMPVQLWHEKKVMYQSREWAKSDDVLNPMITLIGDDGKEGFTITGEFRLQGFEQNIKAKRNIIYAIAAGVTLLAIVLAVFLLNKIYRPLQRLKQSAVSLLSGEYRSVSDSGLPTELKEPVQAFNQMLLGLEETSLQRDLAEKYLQKEKNFISITLDSITNAVLVVGVDKRIQVVNPEAERILSLREKDVIGELFTEQISFYMSRAKDSVIGFEEVIRTCGSDDGVDQTLFIFNAVKDVTEIEYSCSQIKDGEKLLGYVLILRDVTEDREIRRQLNFDAYHDRLTGLINRVAFEEMFEKLVVENHANTEPHIIAYIDLDQFKVVNDTCGHAAGDLLLKQLSEQLSGIIRKTDTLARLGGDEFGLILPYCDWGKGEKIIQSIIEAVIEYRFIWNEKAFSVGVSIGVSEFGDIDDSLTDKMSVIDSACYLAKNAGGNRYHLYTKDDRDILEHQGAMDWVAGINKGLSENRFLLYVQPIESINYVSEERHYEILIRYKDDDGSIIPPGAFLPAAERYNMIERVDLFVVNSVIKWLAKHQERFPKIVFSINLSGRSIGSVEFQKYLIELIQESDVDTRSLCFEITETAIVSDVLRSIDFIHAIRKLGAKFSLDDFGSGLSSFAYLRQFPVDFLKIDGMFVADVLSTPEDYVFIRSMAEVGHCLGMKVIAEFVETKKAYHLLRAAKVDYVQGWGVGKPFPIKRLLEASPPVLTD